VRIVAPAHLARVWFASLLRDGFALTSVGETAPFSELGQEGLRVLLQDVPSVADPDAAVVHIMSGFAELGLHPDVAAGITALHENGVRLVTLSNGAAAVAERLLGGEPDALAGVDRGLGRGDGVDVPQWAVCQGPSSWPGGWVGALGLFPDDVQRVALAGDGRLEPIIPIVNGPRGVSNPRARG
jgi:hypothetical protein